MHIQNLIPPTEQPLSFKPGQAIFTEGDYGDFMYVLLEGSVEVLVHGKSVGTFDPVELFGEMAIIDPQPRSATVMAKTACKLARINRPRFLVLVQGQPEFALQVMQGLVDRIPGWTPRLRRAAMNMPNRSRPFKRKQKHSKPPSRGRRKKSSRCNNDASSPPLPRGPETRENHRLWTPDSA